VLLELFVPTRKNKYEALLLRKPMLFIYSLLLLSVNYIAPVYLPSVDTVSASSIGTDRLLELTNLDRRNAGLESLKHDSVLDQAAYNKAQNMLEEDYWAHFGPNDETPWQFIKDAGYDPYSYAGENLAKGFSTSEGVHQAWMASPTHKDNIMDDDFVDVGYAVVNGYLEGEKTTLVVQMFGTLQSETKANVGETAEIVDNYQSEVRSEVDEDGDITSIKIYNPIDEELINSARQGVYGEIIYREGVENIDGYRVQITEGDILLGDAKISVKIEDGNRWEFTKNTDWEQGEHEVVASVWGAGEDFDTDIETTVSFTVDSVGPELNQSSINEMFNDTFVELIYLSSNPHKNESVTGHVVVDKAIYPFLTDEGSVTVKIPIEEYKEAQFVEVLLYDELGNNSRVVLRNEEARVGFGAVLGLTDSVGMFNLGFVGMLLILLMIQIIQYMRLGLLQHKAHYLFTSGVFSMIILVAIFTKSVGVIG
jgi:uncharacterized protein YkwD